MLLFLQSSVRLLAGLVLVLGISVARADTQAILAAGDQALAHGDVAGSIVKYQQAIAAGGSALDMGEAYRSLGVAQLAQGKASEAQLSFRKALSHMPRFAEAIDGLGNAQQAKGDLKAAIGSYSDALSVNPHFTGALIDRGNALVEAGNYEAAVGDFTVVLSKLDHRNIAALLGRGNAYLDAALPDPALADFNQVLALQAGNPYALSGIGSASMAKGDFARALTSFDASLKAAQLPASSRAGFLLGRGHVFRAQGQFARALADYQAAARLNGADPDLGRYEALTYLELGQGKMALPILNTLLARDPNQPYLLLWRFLARSQLKEDGKPELAQATLKVDSSLWPFPVLALYQGTLSPALAQSAANNKNARIQSGQQCEVVTYAGAWNVVMGFRENGQRLLNGALKLCSPSFDEYSLAKAALTWVSPHR